MIQTVNRDSYTPEGASTPEGSIPSQVLARLNEYPVLNCLRPAALEKFAEQTGGTTFVKSFGRGINYETFESNFAAFVRNADHIDFNLAGVDPAQYAAFLENSGGELLIPGNITNWELQYIVRNGLLEKTTFFEGGTPLLEAPSWIFP